MIRFEGQALEEIVDIEVIGSIPLVTTEWETIYPRIRSCNGGRFSARLKLRSRFFQIYPTYLKTVACCCSYSNLLPLSSSRSKQSENRTLANREASTL